MLILYLIEIFCTNEENFIKSMDDLFEKLIEELKNNQEVTDFEQKYKDTSFYIFSSSASDSDQNTLLTKNNEIIEVLQLGDPLNFIYKEFHNKTFSIKDFLKENLQKIREKTKFNNILEEESNCDCSIFDFGITYDGMIKYLQDIISKKVKRNKQGVILLSNVEINDEIVLILLKVLQFFFEIRSELEIFLEIIILNSSEDKKEKIKELIQKNYTSDNNYKIPFIWGTFANNNKNEKRFNSIKVARLSLSGLKQNPESKECFFKLEEAFNLTQLEIKEDLYRSYRPGNIIEYKENARGTETVKEYKIHNFIFGYSVKLLYRSNFLGKNTESVNKDDEIEKISFSILVAEIEIQKLVFLVQKTEKEGKEYTLQEPDPEYKFNNKSFQKLLDKLMLFLKPGINCFYIKKYLRYDFINSDMIYMNNSPIECKFSGYKIPTKENASKIFQKIFNFVNQRNKEYNIYVLKHTYTINENLKNTNIAEIVDHEYINLFYKIIRSEKKIIDLESEHKKDYSKYRTILLEKKADFSKSIYVHISLDYTYNRLFIYYFKKKFEDSVLQEKNNEYIENSSNLSSFISTFLKVKMASFIENLILSQESAFDVDNFRNSFVLRFARKWFDYFNHERIMGKMNYFNGDEEKMITFRDFILNNAGKMASEAYEDFKENKLNAVGIKVYIFPPGFYHCNEVNKLEEELTTEEP